MIGKNLLENDMTKDDPNLRNKLFAVTLESPGFDLRDKAYVIAYDLLDAVQIAEARKQRLQKIISIDYVTNEVWKA